MIVICKLNLGVGQMGFMFSDLYAFAGDMNLKNLPCLTSVLPGDTSNSRNSS